MSEIDVVRRTVTRRRALQLLGSAAGATLAASCAPGVVAAPSAPPTVPAKAEATLAAATATGAPTPTPQGTPFNFASLKDPLIDDHTHPIAPQQGDQAAYFDGLVKLMDENNVAFSIMHRNAQWVTKDPTFGKDHDDWVMTAMQRHPGRIFGGLGGFDPTSPESVSYVRSQLQTGKWVYVGELDLRNPGPQTQIPINSPIVLQIAKVCAEFKVPLVFHYNYDYPSGDPQVGMREIEDAVAKSPETTFLLAHNPPVPLMPKYANLWGELSLFNDQMPNRQFVQQLTQMAPATLDRLCLCLTDMQTPDLKVVAGLPTPMTYKQAADATRSFLATLPADVHEKIAYKNLMRLLKLS